jgi:hypothetical protein
MKIRKEMSGTRRPRERREFELLKAKFEPTYDSLTK